MPLPFCTPWNSSCNLFRSTQEAFRISGSKRSHRTGALPMAATRWQHRPGLETGHLLPEPSVLLIITGAPEGCDTVLSLRLEDFRAGPGVTRMELCVCGPTRKAANISQLLLLRP